MNIIIREIKQHTDSERATFDAEISFDNGAPYPITVSDPFDAADEAQLEWYFERWLSFPFTKTVEANNAAESVTQYGESLFAQIFKADGNVYAEYKTAISYEGGFSQLDIAIAGSTAFHQLHWESLKDPDHPRPFAIEAPLLRKNRQRAQFEARVQPSPTLNILLVVARPFANDVGYRTISRPLVTALRSSGIRAQIDIVRPGTFQALSDHLDRTRTQRGDGYYHIIHCDMHGEVIDEAPTGAGGASLLFGGDTATAVLAFDGVELGKADLITAQRFADLLKSHQIPMVVLNACQSAKQARQDVEDSQPVAETNLASQLMTAGVQWVVGMGYSVTVSAAEKLMTTLYTQLLAEQTPDQALRQARRHIWEDRERRAAFDQTIQLADWLLPVVYQNRDVRFRLTDFASVEVENAWWVREDERYKAPVPLFGFYGRDLDILRMERRLLQQSNLLLVRGMGGAGKTTLLKHVAEWWQTTGLVARVNYFGYDERAWSLEQIIDGVGRDVFGETDYIRSVQPLLPAARRRKLIAKLRAERHLIILDNLESITGSVLAIGEALADVEKMALREFVDELDGGKTLVLMGSRAAEEWLVGKDEGGGMKDEGRYELGGLDEEAASGLAEAILQRHGVAHYRSDPLHRYHTQQLLELLDGFPLALEVVLANLAHSEPLAVLEQLQAGDVAIAGASDAADRTNNLLKCIEVSHGNLPEEAQQLLLCLAPFRQVINVDWLPQYVAQLEKAFAEVDEDLPSFQNLANLGDVVQEAVAWGLLTPHEIGGDYLRLQPVFPYFLQSRINDEAHALIKNAVGSAFRELYSSVGSALTALIQSKEPKERQLGQVLIAAEYENLTIALKAALREQKSILDLYHPLSLYIDMIQNHQRGLELGQLVMPLIEAYENEKLIGQVGVELVGVVDNVAKRFYLLREHGLARNAYQRANDLLDATQNVSEELKSKVKAGIFHQLGVVVQAQRQWESAESYYQQALQIYIDFDDRYEQADTLHQLGSVAQAQRQWESAESYYQQALQIKIEYKDRHGQAITLHQLGMVEEEQRQWESAESYYQQAMQIKIEYKDRHSQASTLHQLGSVAQAQRQWEAAESYYQQALQIKIEYKDRYGQASTLHQLGRVAEEQRQWEAAESYYQQALQIKIEYKDRYGQAGTLHQLGRVAQRQRQWESAESYYQQALQIKIEYKDRYSQSLTYHQLGTLKEQQQEWSQAIDYLLQDLIISLEFNDEHGAGITMRSIKRVYASNQDKTLPARLAAILDISLGEAQALLVAED